MALRGFVRRHRVAIASNTAVAVAAGAVLGYAISADGYRAHRTELNDGGIWVTKSDRGYFGRMNKPVGAFDGAFFHEDDADLDVVQDGAGVVGINRRSGRLVGIDPAGLGPVEGAVAAIVEGSDVQMAGGTLASLDPGTGAVWGSRFDPQAGGPLVGSIDRAGEPLATVGEDAALAVTVDGTILVASAAEDRLATWEPAGFSLDEPTTSALPEGAGEPGALTAVGEVPVTLDATSGELAVIGGATTTVPAEGVLQQPGQADDEVLVATPDSLLAVDLATGRSTALVAGGVAGEPAEPVRLGACSYAAWSGGTGYVATVCGDDDPQVTALQGKATQLVFRVNRGEIVLNDRSSGTVWDVDSDEPLKIDNWEAFTNTRKTREKDTDDEQQTDGDRRPPKAKPDSFGARPGRTSVLHPLDNDSAPEGRLLAIRGVDKPSMPGARVSISPDGQTLQLSLPDEARGIATFEYYVDDGRNRQAHATVTVQARGSRVNEAPELREGFEPRVWRVPAGGSIEVPVLPDWRDHADSDPLLLESAAVLEGGAAGAVARATTTGRIRFAAPSEGGEASVQYAVSDGMSEPVTQTLRFVVQDKFDQERHAATAEPDVVSGEVGKPIVLRPLANDLPGSDPSTPDAVLALAGRIPDQPGLRVRTDVVTGVVRIDADRASTYMLDYDAAYGNADLASGKIRVDVRAKPKDAQVPIAMPDTLTLYGQASATVDVLANDVDPAGGILVVQRSRPDQDQQLATSIVDGRWLRVSARQGQLSPDPQVVRYTISNGASTATGEVVVGWRPEPKDNTPVTAPDRAVVRAGSVVVHPVLDNDFSPSGDRLELVGDRIDGSSGELEVITPPDVRSRGGSAYVSGRMIRYVAPPSLSERESFTIRYVAANSSGETAEGKLEVVVVPDKGDNTAPEPPTLEGRLVAGDVLKLKLPGTGVDADGDPVMITGIDSVPTLGRVMAFGANSLEFQAYPGSVGTDEFTYTVADAKGAAATGTIRVAVVPPGPPQPPVAVPDAITVAPGATAHVDVLANDQVGAADRLTVELVDPPPGVSLESEIGPVTIKAPATADADQVDVVYTLSNGIDSSSSTASLRTVEGYNNPPVVYDAFGTADDSDAVRVDLLAADAERSAAYDPDGRPGDLSVTDVFADPEIFTREGNVVTVQRGSEPRVVPFRVEDADGGVASASLYVPATGSGRPYLKEEALIELDSADTSRHRLSDFVANPSGGAIAIAGTNRIWTSPPTELNARTTSEQGFEVSARPGFRGPAAVLVEVAAEDAGGAGGDDSASGAEGGTTLVSIPVQVGSDQPELDCPDTAIPVSQSRSIAIDIASVCFVWTLDPEERFDLDYSAEWAASVPGLSVAADGDPVVRVAAAGDTRAGAEGELVVRAGDSEPETLRIEVVRAQPPTLLPVTVPDMRPGSSKEIDLSTYLRAGVDDAVPNILDVQRTSGTSVQASASGSRLVLTAPKGAEGRSEFRVEMSDVSGDPGPERRVTGRISVEVLDVPSVPGAPVDVGRRDRAIRLSWQPSEPQGAPIDHYEVRIVGTSTTQRFRTNGGEFRVKSNGKSYSFEVRAHNKVGYSAWSAPSRSAVADTAPGRVPWIRQQSAGDKTMTIHWGEPQTQTSDIQVYYVTWPGGSAEVPGTERTLDVGGLDNNKTYVFSIRARNKADTSDPRISEPFQSLGTPPPPPGLRVTDQQTAKESTSVLLEWNAVLPEGLGPPTYTVRAQSSDGSSLTVPGCAGIVATSCRHLSVPYDGRTWEYTVTASNQPGNTSTPSVPAVFEAIGRPDPWAAWSWTATGVDNQVTVSYTVPETRGAQSNVSLLVNGGVVGTWSETGPRTRTVVVPNNVTSHQVALRVCNERAANGGCSVSDTKAVQSYGPLNGHLELVSPVVSGDTIRWVIAGDTNGNAASVTAVVRSEGMEDRVFRFDFAGTGDFSESTPEIKVGFRTRQTIEVRLHDDNPGGRGEAVAQSDTATLAPPDPDLDIRRGASCRDGGPNPCSASQDQCTLETCAFVRIATGRFANPYQCTVYRSMVGAGQGEVIGELGPYPAGYNDVQTSIYNDVGFVRLACQTLDQSDKVRQGATTGWFNWTPVQ